MLDHLKNSLADYKPWILSWWWYQNSDLPALNPFPFKRTEDLRETDTLKLAGLRTAITVRENLYTSADFIKNTNFDVLDSLISKTDSMKTILVSVLHNYRSDSTQKALNSKLIAAFGRTSSKLNTDLLFVGNDLQLGSKYIHTENYWMRHHDGNNNNALMNVITGTEYLESDHVVTIEHNLLPNETAVANLTVTPITDDQSRFADGLRGVLETLAKFESGLNFIPSRYYANEADDLNQQVKESITKLQDLAKKVDQYQQYFLAQVSAVTDINETTNDTPDYHSQIIIPSQENEGPNKFHYSVTKNTTGGSASSAVVSDTFNYRVNKLYRIFPMAGVCYTFNQFNDISYDSANKQNKNTIQPHAHFVVGMKVFLRKTDIRSPKFFTQRDENGRCLFLSRTNLTLGFDALSIRNNFYTGIGIDPWPGVSVNCGAAFNRYTYNQYTDGRSITTQPSYRAGFYLGLSTDLSLFSDIAKFLNFTK